MDDFFDRIVYSAANEDPASERRALALGPDDRVLCITGSGARPLDLLVDGPAEVVAVDFNVKQNHLLELKMAAIRRLEHPELLAFLGVHPSRDRLVTLEQLAGDLSEAAAAYWRSEPGAVADGVLYCGVWESYMRRVTAWMGPRRRLLRELVTAPDLETQRALWARWNNVVFRGTMGVLNWRWVWRTVLREPGIELVPHDLSISGHLTRAFERAATERLLRTNPYYNLMVGGGYHDEALPLHLMPEHHATLRAHLDRLRVVHAPLDAHLRDHPNTYTAFSVSDFSSYAPPDVYRDIWEAILVAAVDGARVCERFFLVTRSPEALFPGRIARDPEVERVNAETDHTYIYTFNCCRVMG